MTKTERQEEYYIIRIATKSKFLAQFFQLPEGMVYGLVLMTLPLWGGARAMIYLVGKLGDAYEKRKRQRPNEQKMWQRATKKEGE